jgi:leader peptidase (prepilin peptidase)/N-methyltransferase
MAMTAPPLVRKHALNAATFLLFALAFWRLGLSAELPAVLAFIFGGVLLAVIDWKVKRLPTRLVYLTLAAVAAGLTFAAVVEWNWHPLATAVLGGVLFANAFFLLWFLTKEFSGMLLLGFGDVRLAAVLGLLLGWYGLPYVLYGALAGHVLALLLAVAMSVHQRKLLVRYAFGPPLIAGTLAVVLLHG